MKLKEKELVDDYSCTNCLCDLKTTIDKELDSVSGDFEVPITCPLCETNFILMGEREQHYYLLVSK
jgi:hypothetical protein